MLGGLGFAKGGAGVAVFASRNERYQSSSAIICFIVLEVLFGIYTLLCPRRTLRTVPGIVLISFYIVLGVFVSNI